MAGGGTKNKHVCHLPACCDKQLPGLEGWPSGTPEGAMHKGDGMAMARRNVERMAGLRPTPAGHGVFSHNTANKTQGTTVRGVESYRFNATNCFLLAQ